MAVMIQQQECSSSPSFHLSCSPLAVGHDTEGLAIMLNVGEYRILLDCGLENIKSLLVDQSLPPHWVFCTHAHHDHGRGLLSLHEVYPHLPIYCSEVTKKTFTSQLVEG